MKIKKIEHIQHPEQVPVYDVINAGTLHNFIVYYKNNRFICHNCVIDEANFAKSGVKDISIAKNHMKGLYDTVNARISGTFRIGGEVYGKMFTASSKNQDNDYLSEHIEKQQRAGNMHLYIVDEPQWKILPKSMFSDEVFHFTVGDRYKKGFVIPEEIDDEEHRAEYERQGFQVIEAPAELRKNFLADYDISLRDIAGISVAGAMGFITQESITPCVAQDRVNPFFEDILVIGKDDDLEISDFFHIEKVPQELKYQQLNIHLDLAETHNRTGIVGCCVSGNKVIETDEGKKVALPFIKEVFAVAIEAPRGGRMSFQKVVNFIVYLRQNHFNVGTISADQFQSAYLIQVLDQQGFDTRKLAVGMNEFIGLRNMITDQRIELVRCPLQEDELIATQRMNNKIHHPEDEGGGHGDVADSLCLHSDTVIFTLDGKSHTIEEMYKTKDDVEYYVLSYDIDSEEVVPNYVSDIVCNGYREDLVELILDTGQSIVCTPDHIILDREGNYITAANSLGISLMPFTKVTDMLYSKTTPYTSIEIPKSDYSYQVELLHKLVANYYHSDKIAEVDSTIQNKVRDHVMIHHVDSNPQNNNPDNLLPIRFFDHFNLHSSENSSERKREQLRKAHAEKRIGFGSYSKEKMQEIVKKAHAAQHDQLVAMNKSDEHRAKVSEGMKRYVENNKEKFYKEFISKGFTPEVIAKRSATRIANRKVSPIKEELDAKLREMASDPVMIRKGKVTKLKNLWGMVIDNFGEIQSISWIKFNIYVIKLRQRGLYAGSAPIYDIECMIDAGIPIADAEITASMRSRLAFLQMLSKWISRYISENSNDPFTFEEFTSWKDLEYAKDPNKSPSNKCTKATYEDLVELGAPVYNHRVVAINHYKGGYVYDLKLNNIHNFAVSAGIFVHNCGASSTLIAEQVSARPPARNLAAIASAVNRGTGRRPNPMSSSSTINSSHSNSSGNRVHFPKLR